LFRLWNWTTGGQQGGAWFLPVLTVVAVAVPVFNLIVPTSSAFHLSAYGVTLIGKYLCYGMLALAIDLIWGYCGILSLGQGAFFAVGGYAMGMYLMRQIGSRGVYGNPVLPDFMVFLNYKSLPWFWYGFNHFLFALVMMALAPALLALVFGWFAFRSRVTGVYFSIITQALTYALMLAFFRNDMGFGGNNGFTDFKDILSFDLHSDSTRGASDGHRRRARGQLLDLPRHCRIAGPACDARHPRCGKPHPFSRLSGRVLSNSGCSSFPASSPASPAPCW
jgi:urea transport system permease protein